MNVSKKDAALHNGLYSDARYKAKLAVFKAAEDLETHKDMRLNDLSASWFEVSESGGWTIFLCNSKIPDTYYRVVYDYVPDSCHVSFFQKAQDFIVSNEELPFPDTP